MTSTDACDQLSAFADGQLEAGEADSFRAHLATCVACQAELKDLMMLQAVTETHGAALRALPAERAPAPVIPLAWYRRRRGLLASGAIAVVALAAALLLLVRPEPQVELALANTRSVEPRVTWAPADRHRPYDVLRAAGAAGEQVPASTLAALERRGDWRGLAAGYLLSGDARHASESLGRAGSGPDLDADRAAAALVDGQPEAALRLADGVLRDHPRHAQAMWNRALALRDLRRFGEAALAFDAVAALGEPGWSDEARARAGALRSRAD